MIVANGSVDVWRQDCGSCSSLIALSLLGATITRFLGGCFVAIQFGFGQRALGRLINAMGSRFRRDGSLERLTLLAAIDMDRDLDNSCTLARVRSRLLVL